MIPVMVVMISRNPSCMSYGYVIRLGLCGCLFRFSFLNLEELQVFFGDFGDIVLCWVRFLVCLVCYDCLVFVEMTESR